MDIEAYSYQSFTTGRYGNQKFAGLTLQFDAIKSQGSPYTIFNVILTRARNSKSHKAGTPLPHNQFRVTKRCSFYKFWGSAGLKAPSRLGSFHDYMGNLKGRLFIAKLNNERIKSDSLKPLCISASSIREAVGLANKTQTSPKQMPDNCHTTMPNKDLPESQHSRAIQQHSATGENNYGNTVIRKRGAKGRLHSYYTKPEEQPNAEWLKDYNFYDQQPNLH
ncbi:hypothetical protein [Methylobacillus sp. Pita1]|uniref:hypothetical protein n=1 Tax=Methylobacillus sp. Pita1 TaxID=3382642 RepID=UPI0038B551F8